MRAGEIAAVIEEFAPLRLQESWDNSGFCIGDADCQVHKALIGFDCTPELIEEALETGADMVITHHPLIFGGIRKISRATLTGRAVMDAIRGGVTVYACHTNMDKVLGGVSGHTASLLGLVDVKVLDDDGEGCGLGIIGSLPEPVPAGTFLADMKSALGLKVVRHSRLLTGPVRRVALCGGSGRSLIAAACKAGADVYVTADVSYHEFYAPDGMMIADIGHFESESKIVDVIYDTVREKIPNFALRIASKSTVNPVYYF